MAACALLAPRPAAAVLPPGPHLRAETFVSGLTMPLAIVQDPMNASVYFVVEQPGLIRVVRDGEVDGTFLDLTDVVLSGGERGLFSLVFPPDAATSGRFFVNFTSKPNGDTVVGRFRRTSDPLVADPTSRFDLIWPDGNAFIDQPFPNHNGGHMAFGPDGKLYIALGDGGSGNDPGHRAQNPGTLLGKMLRIDVDVPDEHPTGYEVPPDNPFVDNAPITALAEIWSFGWRNPWRFSFDDPALGGTGAMVTGDVGQGSWEEIDYEPPGRGGRNYGWRNREGRHPNPNVGSEPPAYLPLTEPVHEYAHGSGASVTGGYVYRGTALGPAFRGRYFFADFIQARVWSIALTVNPTTGEATASDLREHTAELGGVGNVGSFGVDADGELFVLGYSGTIRRILPRDPADLIVSGLTPPAIGASGRTVVISNRVRNRGGLVATGPFRVAIFLSPDSQTPGAGVQIGSRTIATLNAGAESIASTVVTIPATTAPGLYFVSAVVDADDAVTEPDEDNNGFTATAQIEIVRPDLTVLAVAGPASGVAGKTVAVDTTVRNIGAAAAGPFAIGIHLSSDDTPGSGPRIATQNVAALAPGATMTFRTTATIPGDTSPATYFLSAVADVGHTVIEIGDANDGTNGANNGARATAPLQVLPFLPDLVTTAVSAPAVMGTGRPLTIGFTIRNAGPAPAAAFRAHVFIAPASPAPAPGDGVGLGFKQMAPLAAGASVATTAVVTVPADLIEGAHLVSIVADGDNTIQEITEGAVANGRLTATPTSAVRPDLQVSAFTGPSRGARGGLVTVTATVRNAAAAPSGAPASTLRFYLSDDASFDGADVELAAVRSIPGLAALVVSTGVTTLAIPGTVTPGAKFLIARADALLQVPEGNENNNTRALPIEIGDFVDLQTTAVAGPAAVATGKPMTVSFTVRNAGATPAGAFRARVFLAPVGSTVAPGDGIAMGFKDFASVGAGASAATSLVVSVPADFVQDSYVLSVVADTDGTIPEIPGNDTPALNGRAASRPVMVVRPDLRVTALTGSVRAARGGFATVTATVRNMAAAPSVAPPSTLKFYLSDDDALDGADLELPVVRAIPTLTAGAASAGVTTLAIPTSATTGPKFVIARADALDQIPEGLENNNNRSLPIEIGDFVDLQITAVGAPLSVSTGKPLTATFTVRNAGTTPAGGFRASVFMAPVSPPPALGDGTVMGFKDVARLGAGASVAASLVVNVPADFVQGSYVLSVVADPGDAIPETGDNDGPAANGRAAAQSVSVVRPDLQVTALTGPVRAGRGGTAVVTATVKNGAAAPGAAPPSTLKFYLSDDQVFDGGDVELAAVRAVPALGPGVASAGATTVVIPSSVTTGTKFLIARADALEQIPEGDDDNNTRALAIEIGDFVDLQITAVAGPATAGVNRSATVSFTVRNAGIAPAGAFRVTLFLAPVTDPAPGPGDGVSVGIKDVASLGTGASLATTAVIIVPAGSAFGPHVLSAVADAGDAIPEAGGSDDATSNGRVAARTISLVP